MPEVSRSESDDQGSITFTGDSDGLGLQRS